MLTSINLLKNIYYKNKLIWNLWLFIYLILIQMNSDLIFLTFVASSSSALLIISVIELSSGVLVNVGFVVFQEEVFESGLLTNKEWVDVVVFSLFVLSFRVDKVFLLVGVKTFLSSTFLNSIGS